MPAPSDTTRLLETSAGPLRVRETGPAGEAHAAGTDVPTVVFLHGLLVSGTTWRHVVEALAPTTRCIVPELPLGAHTLPMHEGADLRPEGIARIVAEVLEALDVREATLVGNDSGGAIAQLVATRHPERVGRLVLATCDAFEVFPPRLFAYLHLVARAPWLMLVLARAVLALPVLARLPLAFGGGSTLPVPREVLAGWMRPSATSALVRRDLAAFLRGVAPRVTLEVAEELHRFRGPVLVVWATAQTLFPVALAERLAARCANARVQWVEGSRAFVQEDRPEVLARALAGFVREPATATTTPAGAAA